MGIDEDDAKEGFSEGDQHEAKVQIHHQEAMQAFFDAFTGGSWWRGIDTMRRIR